MSIIKSKTTRILLFLIVVFVLSACTMYFWPNEYNGLYDSKGNKISANILSVETIVDGEPKKLSFKQNSDEDIVFPPGIYNIELEPDISPVKSIKIFELDTSEGFYMGIEDVPEEGEFGKWVEVYAIDPTKLEFANATVTAVAKGTTLWKCKDYNFKKQDCYGQWIKIMDITPGETYSFILTKEDPIYAEAATVIGEAK